MPVNLKFNSKYFDRTPKLTQEGQAFMLIFNREGTEINHIPQKEPTSMPVIEKYLWMPYP